MTLTANPFQAAQEKPMPWITGSKVTFYNSKTATPGKRTIS